MGWGCQRACACANTRGSESRAVCMWLEGVVGKPGTEEAERVLKRLNRALGAYSGLVCFLFLNEEWVFCFSFCFFKRRVISSVLASHPLGMKIPARFHQIYF